MDRWAWGAWAGSSAAASAATGRVMFHPITHKRTRRIPNRPASACRDPPTPWRCAVRVQEPPRAAPARGRRLAATAPGPAGAPGTCRGRGRAEPSRTETASPSLGPSLAPEPEELVEELLDAGTGGEGDPYAGAVVADRSLRVRRPCPGRPRSRRSRTPTPRRGSASGSSLEDLELLLLAQVDVLGGQEGRRTQVQVHLGHGAAGLCARAHER